MILKDIRFALRVLRQAPVFTFAAVATLALSIGANTAIFSVVNTELLRLLPFPQSSRLVWVAERNDRLNLPTWATSVLNYVSFKEQSRSFDAMGAMGYIQINLTGRGDPEQFSGGLLSPSLFPLLGISATRGRGFQEGEDKPGAPAVAMISEGLWKRRFGSDAALIGQTIQLNDVPTTVVGIAPRSLAILVPGDVWIPLTINPAAEARLNHTINAVGRLKAGVSLTEAQAEMDAVSENVVRQYPEVKGWGVHLVTFRNWLVPEQLRTTLWMLMGAVTLVLLIACANIANLLSARGLARQREIAIRMALGANRGRLLSQFLTESIILSLLGGGSGLLLAFWAVRGINAALPQGLLPIPAIEIDMQVLSFAGGMTLATGILFGIAPAWRAAATELNSVLKQSARSSIGGGHLLRNVLVAAELALATMLLIGAGLVVQSLRHMQRVNVGFPTARLLTFQIALPVAKYPGPAQEWAYWRRMIDTLETIPGVRASAVSSGIPFGAGQYARTPVNVVGKTALPPDTNLPVDWRQVSPGYFRAMGIPILAGREFSDQDRPVTAPAPGVIIVTRETAQRLWGEDDPMGRTVRVVGSGRLFTVIGVAGSVLNSTLNQAMLPAMYFSAPARVALAMDVVVRTDAAPESVLPSVRSKLREIDAELPISNIRTMDEWVSLSAAQPRLNAILLAVFAGVALLIAAIGVYGVLSYSVSQRTREIGLRMALGAQQSGVLKLIVREGMLLAAAGIGVGLLGALAVARLVAGLLYEVPPRDPATYASVAATLAVIAAAACYVPARRASMVDPMIALRDD